MLPVSALLLGVDGGGSKTRALLADRQGAVLGIGNGGSSNYQSVGLPAATHALDTAIAAAFQDAHLPRKTVPAACFGLAGVDRPEDQAIIQHWLTEQNIARQHSIVNDTELLLAAGTPAGSGVALICGTGATCYGRTAAGHTIRAGGWGFLLGDEGSGYDLAIRALRLATQTADGRAAADSILLAVLKHWDLRHAEQLIGRLYQPDVTRAQIATLAQRIALLAESGDTHALALLGGTAYELSRLLDSVVQRLALRQPPVALGGGLLRANTRLQQMIIQGCRAQLGPLTYVADPAQGALILARRLLDQATTCTNSYEDTTNAILS